MADSVNFLDTKRMTKGSPIRLGDQDLVEINIIDDGNCAFNTIAVALVEQMLLGKATLDKTSQQTLINALLESVLILEERVKLYRGQESTLSGSAYTDLADDLENFVKFLKPGINFADLEKYVRENAKTRLQLAALSVGMAPALRDWGVKLYRSDLIAITDDTDAMKLFEDRVHAGYEALAPLVQQGLKMNLEVFDDQRQVNLLEKLDNVESIRVRHLSAPNHWNLLLPVTQTQGILAVIDAPKAEQTTAQILDETQTLIDYEASMAIELKRARKADDISRISQDLPEAVLVAKRASENLVKLKQASHDPNAYAALTEEHSKHAVSMVRSLRRSLHLTERNVHSLKLATDLERDLALGFVAKPVEEVVSTVYKSDETLAHALQSTLLLDFFSSHYNALAHARINDKKPKPVEEKLREPIKPGR